MILLLAACALHPPGALGRRVEAQDAELEALVGRLELAEARIAALEAQASTPQTRPDAATEAAASARLGEATALIEAFRQLEARPIVDDVLARFPGTRAAIAAERLASELAVVGQPAPPLDVETWFGDTGVLDPRRVTLLVFGEAWCPHCRAEAPHLEELYQSFHPQGLDVMFFTRITKSATVGSMRAFIADNGLTFPVAKERELPDARGAMSAAYHVTGIPAAALVKDGVVVWRGHPARLTDEHVRAVLTGPTP
jgi:thiol-disulfide isomerase/thioredoxin